MARFGEMPNMGVGVSSVEQKKSTTAVEGLEQLRKKAPDSEITKRIENLNPEQVNKLEIILDGVGVELPFLAYVEDDRQDEVLDYINLILEQPVGSEEFRQARNSIGDLLA